MGLLVETPKGYLTIEQAAKRLGLKPWDVVRLINSGELRTVTLIDASSLPSKETA